MDKKITDSYIRKESARITDADVGRVIDRADELDRTFEKLGGDEKMKRFISRMRLFMMMVRDYWEGAYSAVPWTIIASVVFAVFYLLNPLDLVPDIIPVVGFLDDAAVCALVWKAAGSDLKKYARWKGVEDETAL